jgi:hypothetical protein
VRNSPARVREGFDEKPGGELVMIPHKAKDGAEQQSFDGEVTVRRLGEVRLPVEVAVAFADGATTREAWDGQYRWSRFRYPGKKVARAVVDPQRKIVLDVDPANNSWVDEDGDARRAAVKWAGRWMLWLQHLLELHMVVG